MWMWMWKGMGMGVGGLVLNSVDCAGLHWDSWPWPWPGTAAVPAHCQQPSKPSNSATQQTQQQLADWRTDNFLTQAWPSTLCWTLECLHDSGRHCAPAPTDLIQAASLCTTACDESTVSSYSSRVQLAAAEHLQVATRLPFQPGQGEPVGA